MNRARVWAWSLFSLALCLAAAAVLFQSRTRKSSLHASWIGVRTVDGTLARSLSNAGPDGLVFEPRCDLQIDPSHSGAWQAYPLGPSNWLAYGGFIGAGHQITMRWNPPTSGVPARVVLSYYTASVDPSRPVGRFANLLYDLGIQPKPTIIRSTSEPLILT